MNGGAAREVEQRAVMEAHITENDGDTARTQSPSLKQQRYLKAKPIALAALDLRPSDRERFVGAACRGDAALLDEVQWMLDAAQSTTATESWPTRSSPAEPRTVLATANGSCYRLLRTLGQGGMGVVYLAERLIGGRGDLQISQPVALKLLRTHLTGEQPTRRFCEEQRILAKLNHPNIAHLVDCGYTDDERPFLAMEYVEGERIDRWCERRKLSLRARLELVLKICSAVHYAHRQCVIHRDIKPVNVLVNESGEPKLLDFGIARLVDPVAGIAAAQTQTVDRALTLIYASPEHIRGAPLTVATDVWSLGVLLYQLSCGVVPFSFDEHGQRVASAEGGLRPPSSFFSEPGAERHTVDIDAIVEKALQDDPAKRHADVAQLADDLREVLERRPWRAWWKSWAGPRPRRRPSLLAGVALSILFICGMGIFSLLSRASTDAERELRRLSAQGLLLAASGNDREAIDAELRALNIAKRFYRDDDKLADYRRRLALVMMRTQPERAIYIYRRADSPLVERNETECGLSKPADISGCDSKHSEQRFR